jgi:Trypsin-co-occurring domain 1
VLIELPMDGDDGPTLLVEVDRSDIPGQLVLASPKPGEAAARAVKSLSQSLEQLEPLLRSVRDRLVASQPDHFSVEFGVRLGGETGIIVAKGTTEANLRITMTWDRG